MFEQLINVDLLGLFTFIGVILTNTSWDATWNRTLPSASSGSFPLTDTITVFPAASYSYTLTGTSNPPPIVGPGVALSTVSQSGSLPGLPSFLSFGTVTYPGGDAGSTWEVILSGTSGGANFATTTQVERATGVSGSTGDATFNFSGTGDPHFLSFRGEKFTFHGEPKKIYAIYSDVNLQINSLFSHFEWSGDRNFTLMENIGIEFHGLKIKVDATNQTITVNDEIVNEIEFNGGFIRTTDHLPEKYASMQYCEGYGVLVKGIEIKLLNYEMFITCSIDPGFPSPEGVIPKLLNITMKINAKSLNAHGIVGQTAMYEGEPRVSTGRNGEGIVEGEYQDYEVSDLFANDFKFSKKVGTYCAA
jgi:hypothetical protein